MVIFCPCCQKDLEPSKFWKAKSTKTGFQSHCIECTQKRYKSKNTKTPILQDGEVIAQLVGIEGIWVSTLGRIWSMLTKGRFLKPYIDSDGYACITLNQNGKYRPFKIHRLVASTFIPNPQNLPFVNHLNGLRNDNRLVNLEWCTPLQNSQHSIKFLKTPVGGAKKVIQIDPLTLKPIETHYSLSSASKKLGISISNISNCLTNRSETAGGYKWQYAD